MTGYRDTYYADIDGVIEFESAALATAQLKQSKDWKLLAQHVIEFDEAISSGAVGVPPTVMRKSRIVYVLGHSDPSRVPPPVSRGGGSKEEHLYECYVCKNKGKPNVMIKFGPKGADGKSPKLNPDGTPHQEP